MGPIRGEIVQKIDLAVKLNDRDPVLWAEGIKEPGGRKFDVLTKTFCRAAHIKQHYDAERGSRGFKPCDRLFRSVLKNLEILTAKRCHRAASQINDTDVHPDNRRLDFDRVIDLPVGIEAGEEQEDEKSTQFGHKEF